ncbi:hypothetical protein GGP41_000801 [Bipolaris sorokiniana]|uniref:Uncharacterized protein n=1 Tax=Cochliobolus sativus TaxID=45130 RepID=A0A8H5ZPS4_COCSA|nr:hypothetical protein GGP41_000801 [Bipolaris sorokiniana]
MVLFYLGMRLCEAWRLTGNLDVLCNERPDEKHSTYAASLNLIGCQPGLLNDESGALYHDWMPSITRVLPSWDGMFLCGSASSDMKCARAAHLV